ncbi:MAG: T9SS type A sorting domain-containing protein [Bacteroidales bacterium]|nr:T9SS type A sorting domain-containing protein [Bacteroidales bacterium]
MIFPILTPNPDSSFYEPDDSTSVQMAAWERYVSVQPNPATDKAKVLSSAGLTQVEVFDMAGNRVLTNEASGLSAKLDVGTLPRGTYIVRIHTPLGVTSRKLVVR